jgi:hypothetical protein
MKNIDLMNMTKGKLSGEEMGKLIMKHYFTDLLEGEKNNPIPFTELKRIVNTLQGSRNIEIYKQYEKLLQFLVSESIRMDEYRLKMELMLWKVSFLLTFSLTSKAKPFEPEEIKGLSIMIYNINDLIKQFFFIQAIMELIIKITKIEDIYCFFCNFPVKLIKATNKLIGITEDSLPVIEYNVMTPETFKKALAGVEDISDLQDEKKMRRLLDIPESLNIPVLSEGRTVITYDEFAKL